MAPPCLDMPRSVGVVRPIILAFRAEDMGSNPIPSMRFTGKPPYFHTLNFFKKLLQNAENAAGG